jgi:hypothetical protein
LPPSNGTTASERRDGAGLAVGRLACDGFFPVVVFPVDALPADALPAVVFPVDALPAGLFAIGALPAGVPHAETSTAPTATPITASTLTRTEPGRPEPGDRLGPLRMIRRQSRRPVSASKCISPKICALCHTHSERRGRPDGYPAKPIAAVAELAEALVTAAQARVARRLTPGAFAGVRR